MNAWLWFYVLLWSYKKAGCVRKEILFRQRTERSLRSGMKEAKLRLARTFPFQPLSLFLLLPFASTFLTQVFGIFCIPLYVCFRQLLI